MALIDKETIRKEIERLKEKNRPLIFACASQVSMEAGIKQETYNEILAILDSLQEHQVADEVMDNEKEVERVSIKENRGIVMKYIDADKLKSEIKIIQQSLESRDVRLNQVKKIRTECMIEFCKCVFDVIDSLQQEQPASEEKFRNLLDGMMDCGFSQDDILLLKSIWEGAGCQIQQQEQPEVDLEK